MMVLAASEVTWPEAIVTLALFALMGYVAWLFLR